MSNQLEIGSLYKILHDNVVSLYNTDKYFVENLKQDDIVLVVDYYLIRSSRKTAYKVLFKDKVCYMNSYSTTLPYQKL